jgi:hypothetical protein
MAEKSAFLTKLAGVHDRLAAVHPSLARGRVWCRSCGASQGVNSAGALRNGWPKCCGYTMTIDSPEERRALDEATHDR